MTQSGVSLWPAQLWCPYGTRDGLENAFGFRPMQVNPGTGSPPNAKPTSPVLTPEQKRYRIERFKNCIKRLEAFDPQNMQHRLGVPEVVTLEAGIDKALSATFGYGTPAYLRFNLAARLDAGPLLTSAALQHAGPRTVGYDEREARDARIYFAEGKQRSLVLLRQAISTVEGECLFGDSEICRLATSLCRGRHPGFPVTYSSVALWLGLTFIFASLIAGGGAAPQSTPQATGQVR